MARNNRVNKGQANIRDWTAVAENKSAFVWRGIRTKSRCHILCSSYPK